MPNLPAGAQPRDLTTLAGRLSAAWDALNGRSFGPGVPLAVREPVGDSEPPLPPRQWQYPIAINSQTQPRRELTQLTPFEQLRNLAALYDVAAMCIGTRVEEMQGLGWSIAPKNWRDQPRLQAQIDQVTGFWKRPDRLSDFNSWLGIVLYDLFSIDALTLYKRPARDGSLYGLDPVDGATIKPLLDFRGRTVAYQQILYGYPETQFKRPSADEPDEELPIYTPTELLYRPRWNRSFTPYGFPPTEWIILRVNMALRKQTFDMAWFTDGNVPDALVSAPEGLMTPQQIQEFEEYFNAILEGQDAARRRMKFMPWGANVAWSKEFKHDPAIDRWMLGVTCAAYGVMPTELGFVEDVNRAQGEVQENINERRGLRPLAKWLKDAIFDPIIQDDLGAPDLQWQWIFGDDQDALEDAQIHGMDIQNGVITAAESRQMRYGDRLEPIAAVERHEEEDDDDERDEEEGEEQEGEEAGAGIEMAARPLSKAAMPPLDRASWDARAERVFKKTYTEQMTRVLDAIEAGEPAEIEIRVAALWPGEPNLVARAVQSFYDDLMLAAAIRVAENLPGGTDWNLVNETVLQKAREWALKFGGEMSATSERQTAQVITDWIASGGETPELVERVRKVWTGPRPDVAATTEVTRLFAQGEYAAYEASGIVSGYNVHNANDSLVRPSHRDAANGGPYPLSDTSHLPPINGDPNCRCWTSPVVMTPEEIA